MKRSFHIWDAQRRREYIMNQHKNHESKDRRSAIRATLDQVYEKIESEKLRMSAHLYAEMYDKDDNLRRLAESAIFEWPE